MRPVIALQVWVHELREREDGQTSTEYAILLGFLAIAIIIALFFLMNVLRGLFSDAAQSVSNAPGGNERAPSWSPSAGPIFGPALSLPHARNLVTRTRSRRSSGNPSIGRLSKRADPRNLSEPNERQTGDQSHAGAVCPSDRRSPPDDRHPDAPDRRTAGCSARAAGA